MRRLTASSLDHARACVGAFVLPTVDTDRPEWVKGRRAHEILAHLTGSGPVPLNMSAEDFAYVDRVRENYSAVDTWLRQTGDPAAARSEVSFALNVITGEVRELGAHIGRAYPDLGPEWICGTADLVLVGKRTPPLAGLDEFARTAAMVKAAIDDEPEVAVLDWKTSEGDGPAGYLGDPRRSLQLLHYAYCAAWGVMVSNLRTGGIPADIGDLDKMPPARIAHAYVSNAGEIEIREARIEPHEWPGVLEEIRAVWQRVSYARGSARLDLEDPPVTTGPHCARCTAILSCPETVQAVSLLAPIERAPEVAVESLPPATLADALTAWRHVQRVGKAVEERAKLLARDGLLPGYRLVTQERREIHGGVAFRVLTDRYGADVAKAAVTPETTQGAIKAAISVGAGHALGNPRGWLKAEVDATIHEIEAAGGIDRRPYEMLKADKEE